MSYHKYYHSCNERIGRPVEIRTNRGVHRGYIERVSSTQVIIRPMNGGGSGSRGYGYGGCGGGCGWGWGAPVAAFAFGAIISLVFLAFLF